MDVRRSAFAGVMRPIASALLLGTALGVAFPSSTIRRACAHAAAAQPAWRVEFDDVCARTQDAMALSTDELKALITRCDRLRPAIEQLDEPQRKVFSRRLQGCRDLYQFVLESKQGG